MRRISVLLRVAMAALPAGVAASEAARAFVPRMLLLDAARAHGDRVVAVGERGTILWTHDNGRRWAVAHDLYNNTVRAPGANTAPAVPPATAPLTTATLTGVTFAGANRRTGWAVGHDALILGSTDGGDSWSKQYQGENLQDSFLDVLALDAQHVIAVGAYGLYLSTTDGGKTWTKRKLSNDDYHFNRLSRGPTGTLYLAGEHGTLLRSADQGATWAPIRAPYEGSFYGILPLDRRTLIAHGLRGHVYRSNDDGATWKQIAIAQPVLFSAAVKLRSNQIVIGGHARALLFSHDFGTGFAPLPGPPTTAVAELIELPDGNVLALGEAGATVIKKPQ